MLYGSGGKVRKLKDGRASVVPFQAQVPVVIPDYRKKKRDFTSVTPKPVVDIAGAAPKKLIADS